MDKLGHISEMEGEFFKFVYLRQLIWYKRFILKEKPPWTNDEILKRYKIINMYRELDRCTIYILKKLENVKDRRALLINVVFYRFFNKDNLYENLDVRPFERITPDLGNKIIERLSELKFNGSSIFNNAYLISSGKANQPKHKTIINNLVKISKHLNGMVEEIDKCVSPEESFLILTKLPMVGPFLACEIWTDLFYFGFFKQGWTDNDFVNIGPGAKWGLEIVYNKKLNKKEQKEKLTHLANIQRNVLPEINGLIGEKLEWKHIVYNKAYSNYPFLSLTNIEGALCEFRKYWNLKQGKGKRRYFKPLKANI